MLKVCMECKHYNGWKCKREITRVDYITGYIMYPDINTYRENVCGVEEARFFEPKGPTSVYKGIIRKWFRKYFV